MGQGSVERIEAEACSFCDENVLFTAWRSDTHTEDIGMFTEIVCDCCSAGAAFVCI